MTQKETRPVRIANCSGFYGDRLSAAREMVEGGHIDVLTGDWLAELTMLILARTREKHPGKGFAGSFVTQMEQVMATCLQKGIKVVANAGGLDPAGCAEAVAMVADRLGLKPRIAYVTGDDLLPRLDELADSLRHFETNEPLQETSRFISANAYLGCWGIVEALNRGADIVITGRTTDAAIVCGPAAWFHRWTRENLDQLAGAVAAGHVIECGTQATGGNYSFFTEVPGLERPGFPWADIHADGSSVIGKHDGTGGQISIGTVTSQLLYEIGSPAYLGPDVTSRFDAVKLEQVGSDRVRMYGCRGEPPPPTLKVAMNEIGGYRNDLSIALTGLNIEAKARLIETAFWKACPYKPADYASVTSRLIRTDKADPASNEEAVAVWKLTLKDPDEKKVGRPVFDVMSEMALASIPGFFRIGGEASKKARSFGVYCPATVSATLVPQHVTLLGEATTEVSSQIASAIAPIFAEPATPSPEEKVDAPHGPTVRVPLGTLVGARSGDKGGNANLGLFVRCDEAWPWLDSLMTTQQLRALLPETTELRIERFALPNVRAINFVIYGLMQEGVAASTRQDGQAKSLCEWVRARLVDVPISLLSNASSAATTTPTTTESIECL